MKPNRSFRLVRAGCLGALLALPCARGASTYTFTPGGAGTYAWVGAENWDGNGVPVDATDATVRFFSDTTTALGSGAIAVGSDPAMLTLNTLTLNGEGADATADTAVNIGSTGNAWTFDGTTPIINLNGLNGIQALACSVAPNISLNQNLTVTGNGTAAFTFAGVISGSGKSLTKSGTSALTLSGVGNNIGAGVLSVSAGSLTLHDGGTLSSSSCPSLGGTVRVDGAGSSMSVGSHKNAMSSNGRLIVSNGGSVTMGLS